MTIYRYYLGAPGYPEAEIFPYNRDELQLTERKDGVRYRTDLSGKLMLKDSIDKIHTDYTTWGLLIIANPVLQMNLRITRDCDNVELYAGKFTYYNCNIDLDKCMLSAKVTTVDIYTNCFDNWKSTYNVLNLPIPANPIQYEEKLQIITTELTNHAFILHFDFPTAGPILNFDFNPSDTSINWPVCPDLSGISTPGYITPPDLYTSGWRLYSFHLISIDNWAHSGVTPTDHTLWVHATAKYYKEVIYIEEPGYPTPPTPPGGYTFNAWVWRDGTWYAEYVKIPTIVSVTSNSGSMVVNIGGATITWTGTDIYADIFSAITYYYSHRERNFDDLMTQLCSDAGYIWESQLLQDATDPLTGSGNNPFANLYILQKSDFILSGGVFPTNPATKGDTTLEKMLNSLKIIFNGDWDAHLTGGTIYLRFEHISFYENGLQYSGSRTIGFDLTTMDSGRHIKDTNKYEVQGNIYPGTRKFSMMEQATLPFIGHPIVYTIGNIDTTQTQENTVADISTDVYWVANGGDEISKDGFLLLQTYHTGMFEIVETVSLPGFASVPNGHLSWQYLHDKLYRHASTLPTGYLNDALINFISYLRLKRQDTVQFPLCCDDINPYELIKTGLGDGEIEQDTLDLKTGIVKIDLNQQ